MERKMERQLIANYRERISDLLPRITSTNLAAMIDIASLPDTIRGFGHVKEQSVAKAIARERELLALLDTKAPAMKSAAE